MNKVILIGRLTRDPELKFTAGSGIAVATFTLAVDRNYTNQSGQREADFIPIVCWRKLAETVANNLSKGRLVAVSGSIQTRKYTAQDGTNRYITEVIADSVQFLDRAKDGGSTQRSDISEQVMEDTGFFPVPDGNDEIPF
ncbi:single-strand binding protein [Caloramator quimbayensis]|uniref:Single-stranded DNA-binding protein n=1 Tax=Caloramator quimbayensis TaxID=1147123 RepID=A0A1T4Y7K0_9CLOT|nr:single-stranded DNA-binding protein [Caloramator quimbayensis]SKA97508.1 single-strand binding protein [Caloramator quimbayensis]